MKAVDIFAGMALLISAFLMGLTHAQPPTDPMLVTLSGQLKRLLKTAQPMATVGWTQQAATKR